MNRTAVPITRRDRFTSALPHGVFAMAGLFGFIILIPGFALYQLALYLGLIGPFLGGYIGIMGVVAFVALLPFVLTSFATGSNSINMNDRVFFLFMMIFAGVSIYYLGDKLRYENAEAKISSIPQICAYYFVYRMMNLESKITKRVFFISLVFCMFAIFTLGLGIFDNQQSDIVLVDNYQDDYANYQFFGMIYIFCAISLIPSMSKFYARIFIYAVSEYILYVNGARSEFIVFALSAGLIEFQLTKSKIVFFSILLVFFLAVALNIQYLFSSGETGRISSLFIEGSGDASVVDRRYTIDVALNTIKNSPIFGDFSNHELGYYAHNFLSAWADFGIFGFSLFVVAIILCLRNAVRVFFRDDITPQFVVMSAMAVSGAFLFLFAKAYAHPIFGVMLALSAQYTQFVERHGTDRPVLGSSRRGNSTDGRAVR